MEARENSLSGFRSALDSGVVQVIDLDTRMRADGVLVVMHDPTVDRVSRAHGRVSKFTATTWPKVVLDIGSWLTPEPPPEVAPTLATVLDRFGGKIVLTMEAKDSASVDQIASMIKSRGLTSSTYVNTNDPDLARRIHDLGLHTQLWRSAAQMHTDDPTTFAPYVDVLDADITAGDADFRKFADSGVPEVWAHTLTTRAERDRAIRLGANGIVTDTPRYITGATDTYPAPPTVLDVVGAPAPVQVSDATSMTVGVSPMSGPGLPDAPVSVTGHGLTGSQTDVTPQGVRTLRLATTRDARRGTVPLELTVTPGSGDERRWGAGRLGTDVRVNGEDLQVRPKLRSRGLRVRIRLRLLDSAADHYSGPRREQGTGATLAGLDNARLTVRIRRHGHVLDKERLRGQDTGAVGNGDGRVQLRWRAPSRGRYAVQVTQTGKVYRSLTVTRHFRLP
jgi:glycerophosphoryl diester phosphodiesterase